MGHGSTTREFQCGLADMLKSLDDQLAAQVDMQRCMMAQHAEFQWMVTEVIAGLVQSQQLLEQLEQMWMQGPG